MFGFGKKPRDGSDIAKSRQKRFEKDMKAWGKKKKTDMKKWEKEMKKKGK